MKRITLALNTTEVKTRNKSVLIRGDYLFVDQPGTYNVEITPDIENEKWILCIGQIDNDVARDFATFRTAHELHRGIAWMVTQQQLLWNDLRIITSEEILNQLNKLIGKEETYD
jgi:hypothetical protein